jgi:signal transduction histidine kinase
MQSFRNRIRYFAVGLVAALLLAFNVFVYWGSKTFSERDMDARLHSLALTVAHLFERHPKFLQASELDILGTEREVSLRVKELHEVLHSVQVLNLDGAVVWKGLDVLQNHPADRAVLERIVRGETVVETVFAPTNLSVRRVVTPIRQEGTIRFALQAEASRRYLEKTRSNLMMVLATGSALGLVLAWLGAGWIARQVLLPVKTLSRTAEQISVAAFQSQVTLHVHYREFQQLCLAFNGMLDRLRKAYESQRRFVDDAAHEIHTPLSVIRGNLEWAVQRRRTPQEYGGVIAAALKQVDRLIALAKALLMLARFGTAAPPVQLVPVMLEPLVRDLVDDLRPLASDRGIHLMLESEPVPEVQADQNRLTQLLINLLDNAFRYSDSGKTVTVRVSRKADHVTVSVQDAGPGIAPETLSHIFERFYRNLALKDKHPHGLGLGLAIVKEIAEAHYGSVAVESQVGCGSTFTLSLPVRAR